MLTSSTTLLAPPLQSSSMQLRELEKLSATLSMAWQRLLAMFIRLTLGSKARCLLQSQLPVARPWCWIRSTSSGRTPPSQPLRAPFRMDRKEASWNFLDGHGRMLRRNVPSLERQVLWESRSGRQMSTSGVQTM